MSTDLSQFPALLKTAETPRFAKGVELLGGSRRLAAGFVAATLMSFIAACSSFDDVPVTPSTATDENPLTQRPYGQGEKRVGTLIDGGLTLGSTADKTAGAQLPVNKHIWRATLDTISSLQFLTLASTDPYGGVIITDWGVAPESPDEQLKVTAFITSAELKPQSLNVQVNRQRRDPSGAWVAAPVAEQTASQLEDAILTRARQLRIESGDSDD